jgi:hypothetical protein
MKAKILSLFSLLALLLVSTSILADGRPTGIRIGRLVSGGNQNVELDVTVTGTNRTYSPFNSSNEQWIGYDIWGSSSRAWQVTSNYNEPLPFAVDWGDSSWIGNTVLFRTGGSGPWRGTFAHTYTLPGVYTVTVGDAYGTANTNNDKGTVPFTGNAVTASTRYVWGSDTGSPYNQTNWFENWTYSSPGLLLAITDQATVNTGTGIPALNIWGLLAMGLVLVGTGVLVFKRSQRTVV